MTLDAIYMPLPARSQGRRVSPLGDWPRASTEEERAERRREQWRRYARDNRQQRTAYTTAWKAAKRAAA